MRSCIAGVITDISAIKSGHPELIQWQGARLGTDGTGFSYKYKFKGWAKAESLVEPGGCLILIDVKETQQIQWSPRYRLANLGLDIYAFVQGGQGLVDAVNGIIEKRLAPLTALNRARGPRPATGD